MWLMELVRTAPSGLSEHCPPRFASLSGPSSHLFWSLASSFLYLVPILFYFPFIHDHSILPTSPFYQAPSSLPSPLSPQFLSYTGIFPHQHLPKTSCTFTLLLLSLQPSNPSCLLMAPCHCSPLPHNKFPSLTITSCSPLNPWTMACKLNWKKWDNGDE